MATTTYQVILSVDGKHSVGVTADDPAALKAALAWAKKTYEALVARSADKEAQEEKEDGDVPICAVHNVPMVWQKGRRGFFWSCHKRNEDGSFCSYRPANS